MGIEKILVFGVGGKYYEKEGEQVFKSYFVGDGIGKAGFIVEESSGGKETHKYFLRALTTLEDWAWKRIKEEIADGYDFESLQLVITKVIWAEVDGVIKFAYND